MHLSAGGGVRIVAGSWFLVEDDPRPGADNMARDLALLDLSAERGIAFLRLYRWEPFCLSFGRNEPALRRYDRDHIERLGLSVVRRPTGGRAVWHARELTYAVVAPVSALDLAQSYRQVHRWLAAAIGSLGGCATLAPQAHAVGVGAGACFASSAGGEVMVDGEKTIGSAQLRQGPAFLQHGSILVDDDQSTVARVTRGPAPPISARPLRQTLGPSGSVAALSRAVVASVGANVGELVPADPPLLEEIDARAAAHRPAFQDPAWTWRR